jgi:hypothetical protein
MIHPDDEKTFLKHDDDDGGFLVPLSLEQMDP